MAEERPPNMIVIMADDLGCRDMQLYDGWVAMPKIEQMAREGMTFTDFHTNSSVCSPTRAAFLSGRYQQRFGIVDVIVGNDHESDHSSEAPTFGQIFQKNDYATGLFGKWHLGYVVHVRQRRRGNEPCAGPLAWHQVRPRGRRSPGSGDGMVARENRGGHS